MAKSTLWAVMFVLGGCAGLQEAGYERHHMSMIRAAEAEPGVFIFEARTDADHPADSAPAERQRLEWLEQWLAIRGWCRDGYELLDRRPLDARDLNLYHMDLSYRLKCAQPAP